MRAGAEPGRYNLSYSISLKFFFALTGKKRCSEASRFKLGSSLIFSNLKVSEIIFQQCYCKVFNLR